MDYVNSSIPKLFFKQLVPNILSMVFSALFIIVDGIFVGRGVGSDALAAVNVAAPIFAIMTGIGLMFGMGAAILSTIALSQGKRQLANVIATQSYWVSIVVMLTYTLIAVIFPKELVILFGAPADIVEGASTYLMVMSSFSVFMTSIVLLPYFIRISSPNYALFCMIIATVLNIGLDYLFIFVFKWGLFGAAFATGLGEIIGTAMLIIFLIRNKRGIRLVRLPLQIKALTFIWKNSKKIVVLGFAVLLSELTISVMAIAGNYTFSHYLGVDGIAAFSIVNYSFPVVYMVFNAIAQSAQPIISYHFGLANAKKCNAAFSLSLKSALVCGILFIGLALLLREQIVSLFIADHNSPAWKIAVEGIPYFSIEFLFFAINILFIGYYMSIKQSKRALIYTSIRGVLPVFCFILVPIYLGTPGIWLAEPIGEMLSAILIIATYKKLRFNHTIPLTSRP